MLHRNISEPQVKSGSPGRGEGRVGEWEGEGLPGVLWDRYIAVQNKEELQGTCMALQKGVKKQGKVNPTGTASQKAGMKETLPFSLLKV